MNTTPQSVATCIQMLELQGVQVITEINNLTNEEDVICSDTIPTTTEVFRMQPVGATVGLVIAMLICAATIGLFIEEVIYVYVHFGTYGRRTKTIVVLGLYPVMSFTSLLGYAVPRAGTLVDLMANMYLSICMLHFLRLLVDYFGGSKRAWNQVEGSDVRLRTPPCCCCMVCLPTLRFDRNVFMKLQVLVMQVAIIRPLLMFIAAVLWADGSYTPGVIAADNAYIYIAVINIASSMWAVYGLIILKNTFSEALHNFNIGGKFISLQMVLLLSVIPNLFINILVQYQVIPCDTLFSSKARGERIYHLTMVVLMLPVSLIGRFYYRRKQHGKSFAEPKKDEKNEVKKELYPTIGNNGNFPTDLLEEQRGVSSMGARKASLASLEDLSTYPESNIEDSFRGKQIPLQSNAQNKQPPVNSRVDGEHDKKRHGHSKGNSSLQSPTSQTSERAGSDNLTRHNVNEKMNNTERENEGNVKKISAEENATKDNRYNQTLHAPISTDAQTGSIDVNRNSKALSHNITSV